MKAAELCPLSDLQHDQCAHCRHRRGGPDPASVEQLEQLGHGYQSRDGIPIELGATFDSTVARWRAPKGGECGLRGCVIKAGDLVGRDSSGVLVCKSCLPDSGGLKVADHQKGKP